MLVDDNSRGHRQAGVMGQFDIGQHADADDHKIGRQVPAVAEADAGDTTAIALDAGRLYAEMDANPRGRVSGLKKIRYFRGHRARHDARAELDHIHLEPLGPRGGGEFQANEARSDDNDALARCDPLPQRFAFVQRPQIAHGLKIGVGDIEQPIARPGRQHQMPIFKRRTGREQ